MNSSDEKKLFSIFSGTAQEIINLTAIYHGNDATTTTSSDKSRSKVMSTLMPEPKSIDAYNLGVDAILEVLEHNQDTANGKPSSSLIPTMDEIDELHRDFSLISFGKKEKFQFRVKYIMAHLFDQVKSSFAGGHGLVSHSRKSAGPDQTPRGDNIQQELAIENEESQERLYRSCIRVAHLERVLTDLRSKMDNMRTNYLKEIQYLRQSNIQKGWNGFAPSEGGVEVDDAKQPNFIELAESVITPAERKALLQIIGVEKIKNEKMQRWVSNLKMQLKMEKMRERETEVQPSHHRKSFSNPTPTLPHVQSQNNIPNPISELPQVDESIIEEQEEFIKQLRNQITELTEQLAKNAMPIVQEVKVVEQDPKLLAKLEQQEKHFKASLQKIGDLERENQMVIQRNRELQMNIEEIEKDHRAVLEQQQHSIESLEVELQTVKEMNTALLDKEKTFKSNIVPADQQKKSEKQISALQNELSLSSKKIETMKIEIDDLKLRLSEMEKKEPQVIMTTIYKEADKKVAPVSENQEPIAAPIQIPKPETVPVKPAKPSLVKRTDPPRPKSAPKTVKRPKTPVRKVLNPKPVLVQDLKASEPEPVTSLISEEKVEEKPMEILYVPLTKPTFRSTSMPNLKPTINSATSEDSLGSWDQVYTTNIVPIRRNISMDDIESCRNPDKAFLAWLPTYAKQRSKIIQRVLRRWKRLSVSLVSRKERRIQRAQERGVQYHAFAISQIPLPKEEEEPERYGNVFKRLQTKSSSKKEVLLNQLEAEQRKEWAMKTEMQPRWAFESQRQSRVTKKIK